MLQHIHAFAIALRLSAQPGQEMPEQAVIALNRISFGFRLGMQFWRHELFIGAPVVAHDIGYAVVFDGIPELAPGFRATGAHFAVEEALPISINSNPYPAIVFFEPT